MATREGISDEDFRQLLVDVSKWYDDHEYTSMLKILYRDHVTNSSQLQNASKVIDLLGFLYASGDLSPTDLTLLYDTIKATQQFGLERIIKDQIPSCPNMKSIVISKFTPHRQKLMKLGMALTHDDVVKISGLYNNPVKRYADSWSLINDLEHKMIICEKEMETFVKKLKRNIFPQAVDALLKEFGKVPPEKKPQSTGQPSNKRSAEYDCYVVSENIEWEKEVLKELQKRKPAVKCQCRKDWKCGKSKLNNFTDPLKQCQKVIVGFTSQSLTGNLEFVAVQQMLDNNTLDQGKLIPVRITKDAEIPDYLEPITANGWEEDFYDKLLNTLNHEDQPPAKRPKLCKSSDHEKKTHNVGDESPLHPQILKRRDDIKLPSSCTALNLSDFIKNIQQEGISLVCTAFDASSVNLSSITGETLFSLLMIVPRLKYLHMDECELSSDIVNDMVSRYLDSNNCALELELVSFGCNNLSNIDGEKISRFACKVSNIYFPKCKLSTVFVEQLVSKCTACNFTLKLTRLNIAFNHLRDVKGTTLSSLLNVAPLLGSLDLRSCELTGEIVNEMVQECNNNQLTLALKWFDIGHNDLSEVEGRNLDTLLKMSPELHTLDIKACMLTGGIVNDMVIQSGQHNNFHKLYLSSNNLEDMDVTLFVNISKKFPNLECLSMTDCNLDDKKLKDMMDACKDGDVVLKDNVLRL